MAVCGCLGSNTIENVFCAGTAPSVAIVDFSNSTRNNIPVMGYIGATSDGSSTAAWTPIARSGGGVRALTADFTALHADNNITYTNAGASNYVVTLPTNLYAGWRCKALQLSTGTISFVTPTGATAFISETGGVKTGGQNALIEVWCYENTSTMSAPKFHVRGKSVV